MEQISENEVSVVVEGVSLTYLQAYLLGRSFGRKLQYGNINML